MHYPVNQLRNVALDQAKTDYVFLTDIDFLPMNGLYEYLKDAAAKHDISKQKLVSEGEGWPDTACVLV